MIWKIKLFCKFVWYEAANMMLRIRIRRAWEKAGMVQEELDRIKRIANGR